MDALDLFNKLRTGAKFDYKRFEKDFSRVGLAPTKKANHVGTSDQLRSDKNEDATQSTPEIVSDKNVVKKTKNPSNECTDSSSEVINILGDLKAASTESTSKSRKRKRVNTAALVKQQHQEEINRVRRENRIHVYGTDVPDPISSFSDLERGSYGVHSRIIENIRSVGYESPTPIQLQTITVMLERREIMACAPTGSGKTAAFIIPVLHHLKEPRNLGFRALVLAPTRELAKQTYLWFQRLSEGIGFRVFLIEKIGSAKKIAGSKAAKKCGMRQINSIICITKLDTDLWIGDVLVTTPKRLVYLIRQDPPLVDLKSVEWLIVDESDKLFEEGKSGFREQIAEIYNACDNTNIRRAMFSATFAHDVEEWCKENLDNVVQVYIGGRNAAVESVKQELVYVGSEDGKMIAMRDLIHQGLEPPVLVFVQSRERARQLFQEMLYDGINVEVIHADRTQKERDNIVRSLRVGDIWVLICTELMGRGIDFYGIKLVINFDFPTSAISYIHRIGRTGRAGQDGRAVTFFTDDDAIYLRNIANVMREAGCPVPDYMVQIKKQKAKDKRKLAKRVPVRDKISTVPECDIKDAQKKRNLQRFRDQHAQRKTQRMAKRS